MVFFYFFLSQEEDEQLPAMNTLRRSTMTSSTPPIEPLIMYSQVPSFYGNSAGGVSSQQSGDTITSSVAEQQPMIKHPTSLMTCHLDDGTNQSTAAETMTTSIKFRDKCISFLALITGLAALTCAFVAMAGTASWVDTWEPIDLPPVEEWPALFGTGYGTLLGGAGGKSSKTKAGGGGGGGLYTSPQPPIYPDSYWLTPQPESTISTSSSPSIWTTTTDPSATTKKSTPTTGATTTTDDYDEDDYYADDMPVMEMDQGQSSTVASSSPPPWAAAVDNPQSARYSGSLVVVFHVGLFRACPVLKGQLPSNVGKNSNLNASSSCGKGGGGARINILVTTRKRIVFFSCFS